MNESGFLFLHFSSIDEKRIQAIRAFTHELITKTMNTLNVSHEIAFLLLDHLHWNQEELNSKWASSQNELLKAVHIKLGGTVVPNLESHLSAIECGTGTCPACSRERRLMELYCGHKICNDCLIEEIKNALSENRIPTCREDECKAEILSTDVEKLLPHSKNAKVYKSWRLNLSYENSPFKVAVCPNPLCKYLIIRDRSSQCCHVRCPKCEFAVCMNCQHDAHTPLNCCKRVTQFTETIPKDLSALEAEEQKWISREIKCAEYRFQKQGEVEQDFDRNIRVLVREQANEQKEVLQQIKNTDLFVQDLLTKISNTEDKIGEYKQKKRSAERIESLEKNIDAMREEIEHYKEFKAQLEKENEVRKEERKKDLEFIQEQKKLFLNSIQDKQNQEALLHKYKEFIDQHAVEKATAIMNEEDYIRQKTVICPSCGLRFYKDCGCCEVKCPCGYDFCTICNEPWITHKKGFYQCQNEIPVKKVDYNDQNDSQFYPPPMNLEKKIFFARWKHFHDSFIAQKAKYEELYKKFLATEDTDAELSTLTKIIRHFEQENSEEGKTNAIKLVSNVLFAQSVVGWGYAALYYLNITEFTQEYIGKLQNLENKINDFVELLNDPAAHEVQEIQDRLNEIKEETELVLKEKL